MYGILGVCKIHQTFHGVIFSDGCGRCYHGFRTVMEYCGYIQWSDGNSKLTEDGMLATYASFKTFLEMIRIAPSIDITEQEEVERDA